MSKNIWGGPGLATITLACGDSKRFQDVGYATPKQFLVIGDDLMCNRVRENLTYPHISYTILKESDHPYIDHVDGNMLTLSRSRGQADTIYQALTHLDYLGRAYTGLLILNCDAGFAPVVLDRVVADGRCNDEIVCSAMEVDPSEIRRWSFVDGKDEFTSCREKELAAPGVFTALTGAYYIPRLKYEIFYDALSVVCHSIGHKEEPYISAALRGIQGRKRISHHMRNEFYDWGTPEALESYEQGNHA